MRRKRYDKQMNVSLTNELKTDMETAAANCDMALSEFAREAIKEKILRMQYKKARK